MDLPENDNVNESNEPLEMNTIIQLVQIPTVHDKDSSESSTVITSKLNTDNIHDANQQSLSSLAASNDNNTGSISLEQPMATEEVMTSNKPTSTDWIQSVSKDANNDEK